MYQQTMDPNETYLRSVVQMSIGCWSRCGCVMLSHSACAALRCAAETCRRAATLLDTVARDGSQPGLVDVIDVLTLTLAGLRDIAREDS